MPVLVGLAHPPSDCIVCVHMQIEGAETGTYCLHCASSGKMKQQLLQLLCVGNRFVSCCIVFFDRNRQELCCGVTLSAYGLFFVVS